MDDRIMWHGSLSAVLVLLSGTMALAATPPDPQTVPKTTAQRFEVAYDINADATPLRRVELWYTFDQGTTWQHYGEDDDRRSPFAFAAAQEGLCGLYVVATNAAGHSGPNPDATTEPHLWTFIDYTAPVGQLHAPRVEHRPGGQTLMHLRWTAMDQHLATRPIDLEYRALPYGVWQEVSRRLPNSGRYDWKLPADVSGEVMFRLTVRDRGGHESRSATAAINVDPPPPAEAPSAVEKGATGASATPPTEDERQRARELLHRGRYHQLREEHDLAASRFRDALRLDPEMPEALVKLGGSLYALERYDEAAGAYELALRQSPSNGGALEGLAEVLVALRKYDAAEAKLLTLIEQRPGDASTWLHLGDVAIMRGSELDARDYYTQAVTLQPESRAVVAKAQARLDDLGSLRRNRERKHTP